MITQATDKLPEIEWEVTGELLYKDSEERMTVYFAGGFGTDGKNYQGSAEYSCGELIDIRDIEEI